MSSRLRLFRDVGMSKYLLPVILFFILTSFLFVGLYRDPTEVSSPLVGKPVPQFSLPRLDNSEALFSEREFLGKVSLLNVWASWCVACLEEHPVLSELANRNAIIIYGLNYKDDVTKAHQYLVEHGNPYLANAVDAFGRVGIEWGVYGVPETFVVDKKGVIRYKHIGVVTQQDVEEKLLPLIGQLQSEVL